MPIFLGNTELAAIYYGSSQIAEVYKGSTKLWPSGGGGVPAGTVLLGPTDLSNFTDDTRFLVPDDVYYYFSGYSGIASASANKARIYMYEDPTTGSPYITLCLWDSSGTLLAYTEVDTNDGDNWYSGTFDSAPSIVEGTTYYLGVFAGGYVGIYRRPSDPTYVVLSPSGSISYGSAGSNPTPPNVSPSTDPDSPYSEIPVQLVS